MLLMNMGIFLHPLDLRILVNWLMVDSRILAGHISILVTTLKVRKYCFKPIMTGTLRARLSPRCSFVIPMMPALAPTIRIT